MIGGSAAQSSMLQLLDAALSVQHDPGLHILHCVWITKWVRPKEDKTAMKNKDIGVLITIMYTAVFAFDLNDVV